MPISGLSDDVRIPRLGKIRLGIRVKNKEGVEHPEKTDYFVFPKEGESSLRGALVKAFGEEPKALRILIPAEDDETWCEQYYKLYQSSRDMVCKGDGKTACRTVDVKTGELPTKTTQTIKYIDMPCKGRECPQYGRTGCGEVMNLRFVLPEVPGLGVWQIDTGSINSILNINSCAKLIRRAFGRISLIPLILSFDPIDVKIPESGKKSRAYVLNLRTDVTLAQLADVARNQAKQFAVPDMMPMLEAAKEAQTQTDIDTLWGDGVPVDRDTGEIIDGEIIPPTPADAEFEKLGRTPEEKSQPMTFANPGEFYTACLTHFKLDKSAADKEIAMYDLTVPAQRVKAWQQIVGTYQK